MKNALIGAISLLFTTTIACGQEQGFTHYDINNGLAGSTVYCMVQDHQGFLWFGTETGVSRFDGSQFKNFTTEDGLPDNDILEMFVDSKGRVWMAPFKRTVCYYYKGKIFNADNDPLLRKIVPSEPILRFAEDRAGNILMQESTQLFMLSNGHVTQISSIDNRPFERLLTISSSTTGNFLVLDNGKLYEMQGMSFKLLTSTRMLFNNFRYTALNKDFLVWRNEKLQWVARSLRNGTERVFPYAETVLTIRLFGDSLLASNNQTGTSLFDLKGVKPTKTYLENKVVARCLIDNERNFWFATMGEGIYRLNSEIVVGRTLKNEQGRKVGVNAIAKYGEDWLIGADMLSLFRLRPHSSKYLKVSYPDRTKGQEVSHRITAIEPLNGKRIIVGTDLSLEEVINDYYPEKKIEGPVVKSFFRKSSDELLVATRSNVLLAKIPGLKIMDTLWKDRSTTIFYRKDTFYVGTLDGLYLLLPDRSIKFAGDSQPLLRNRINAIQEDPNGTLWIATNGAGLLGLSNGKIVSTISERSGLSSNICRTLLVDKDRIWVGTNKGLNKIIFQPHDSLIIKYSMADGLFSNQINTLYVDSNLVMVGTPEGINYFDERQLSSASTCTLVMDDITVSGRKLSWNDSVIRLTKKDNNIQFKYSGISFKSGGDIQFQYRLLGLDSEMKVTRENFLNYPTLPSGEYELQMQAINKFGVKSRLIKVPFVIEKSLMEKTWFQVLLVLAGAGLILLFVRAEMKRFRKKERQKSEIKKRISELEQLALKSQMNPHFIFNSLNSIQQYVLDKDIAGGNKFITSFSRLIRQTLDISARKEITIAEEIKYLSTYLELEKSRFEHKFKYHIGISHQIDPENCHIPPLLLQPFVENSIRHGIRLLSGKNGMVKIQFKRNEEYLFCIVEDNGVGIKWANLHKSKSPVEYQSKGVSLVTSRVELINKDNLKPIKLQIEDLEDFDQNATGTRVVIAIPLEQTSGNKQSSYA